MGGTAVSSIRASRPALLLAIVAIGACARQQSGPERPITAPRAGPTPAAPAETAAPPASTESKLVTAVSILPQAYLLQRVGGTRVQVLVLVQQGQSAETYEPTAQQMTELATAKAYFQIGMPFERALVEKITSSMPGLHVVDSTEGITLRPMDPGLGHGHETEEAEVHHTGAMDPHIWLDPQNAKRMAHTMHRELVRLDPRGSEQYEKNLAALDTDLDQLDQRIARSLAPLQGGAFLVYHPAFGYLADAYGLRQIAIEAEGKEPGPKQMAQIIQQARQMGIKVVFVQPEFPSANAMAIAEQIGGAVVPINPLGGDYIENLSEMASTIRTGLVGASDRGR